MIEKNKLLGYFSKFEYFLITISLALISTAFFVFDGQNYFAYALSILGAFALILSAKGNALGVAIMIVFSVCYAIISYFNRYYGETLTYALMTLPMSIIALISWLKNPYKNKKAQVSINKITKREVLLILALMFIITIFSYPILRFFNTKNIVISTISIATSFFAVSLTYKRSPFFALAYALNDVVLMVLWFLATLENTSYVSILVCFVVFLINDLYGFYNWLRMRKQQLDNF